MIARTTIAISDERHGLADDRHQRLLGHVGEDEQQQTVRRCEQSDHDVDDDHDAEMHEVDPSAFAVGIKIGTTTSRIVSLRADSRGPAGSH